MSSSRFCLWCVLVALGQVQCAAQETPSSACGYTVLTRWTGTIDSPNYPRNYPGNVYCEWYINAPATHWIDLVVQDFRLEGKDDCKFDFLKVYRGNSSGDQLLDTFCGTSIPQAIEVPTNNVLLVFRSDDSVSYQGFRISYVAFRDPTEVTCSDLTVQGEELVTSCTTPEINSEGLCEFQVINLEHPRTIQVTNDSYITYEHIQSEISPGQPVYKTTCTLRYPTQGLQSDQYQVAVHMVIKSIPERPGVRARTPNKIWLTRPNIHIDRRLCPFSPDVGSHVRDGYIQEGASATCLCILTNPGNPPASLNWISSDGNFSITHRSERSLEITVHSEGEYLCVAKSPLLGATAQTFFTPKFSYGPTSPQIKVTPYPDQTCPSSDPVSRQIVCSVDQDSYNFAPYFNIKVDGLTTLAQHEIGARGSYQMKNVSHVFSGGGEHRVTCKAENSLFPVSAVDAPDVLVPVTEAAVKPWCGELGIEEDSLTTVCGADRVFPHGYCVFSLRTEDRLLLVTNRAYVTYSHDKYEEMGVAHFRSNCTIRYPIAGLTEGNYSITVDIYPGSDCVDQLYQRTTGTFNSIELCKSLPRFQSGCDYYYLPLWKSFYYNYIYHFFSTYFEREG